jgi:glycosyltransferase involved in cell wall biosynthesis
MPSAELEEPATPAAQSERAARVTIALPTFNRAHALQSAIDSVLRQTYGDWALIISDNASTDETQSVCERAAALDERITYIRQPVNLGAVENFNFLSTVGRGPFFMYLADDDWLAESFLERCVAVLEDRSDVVLAGAVALRSLRGEPAFNDRDPAPSLEHRSGARRVLGFIGAPGKAAYFHGVRRTSAMKRAGPLRNRYGADDMQMAATAYLGKVAVVGDTHYHKNFDVAPSSEDVARKLQLSRLRTRHPSVGYVAGGIAEIGWRRPAYKNMPLSGRVALALASMALWLAHRSWTRHLRPSTHRALGRARRRLRKAVSRSRRRLRRLLRPVFRRVRKRWRRVRRGVRRTRRRTIRLILVPYARVGRLAGRIGRAAAGLTGRPSSTTADGRLAVVRTSGDRGRSVVDAPHARARPPDIS